MELFRFPWIFIPPANIVWEVYRNLPVCLSGPTSTSFVRFPPNSVEFKIMMCELCSIKDFYCPLSFTPVMPLWTIQYSLCHHKFSYMINQKFMKLCTLQDPNMKMCTLVVYPGTSSFPRIMSLKVVFQICLAQLRWWGRRGY